MSKFVFRPRKSVFSPRLSASSGFSLVELLIYIAILAAVSGVAVGILTTITKTQVQESALTDVSGQIGFITQTIQRLVRDSSLIDMTAGTATSTLKLRMPNLVNDPTLVYLSNGQIYVQQGTNPAQTITGSSVNVDSLQFTKLSQAPGKDTVQIDLAVSAVQKASGTTISRALRTAVARVNAATFDSDLLPNTDNAYNVGANPSNRWLNGAFSGNLTTGGNAGIGTTNLDAVLNLKNNVYTPPLGSSYSQYGITLYRGSTPAGTYGMGVESYYIGFNSNGGYKFYQQASSTPIMVIGGQNSTNVGIGTTTPGSLLDVRGLLTNKPIITVGGSDTQTLVALQTGQNLTDNPSVGIGARIVFVDKGTGGQRWDVTTGILPGNLAFRYNNTSNTMVLTSNNVGIGTDTPTTAGLVVTKNVSGASIDAGSNRIINVATPTGSTDAANKAYVDAAAGGGSLSVYASDGTTLLGKYLGSLYTGMHDLETQYVSNVAGYTASWNHNELDYFKQANNMCDLTLYLNSSGVPTRFRSFDCDTTPETRWYFKTTNCSWGVGNPAYIPTTKRYVFNDGTTNWCYSFSRNSNLVFANTPGGNHYSCTLSYTYNTYGSYRDSGGSCVVSSGTIPSYALEPGDDDSYYTSPCGNGACIIK